MTVTHILGFPRIGAQRELKFALETFWEKESDLSELEKISRDLRKRHWQQQTAADLDYVTVGDFSYYDHVLDLSLLFGVIPERFQSHIAQSNTETYFQMARGFTQDSKSIAACEMTKWFDTNYHYIVPEFSKTQTFSINANKLCAEVKEAKALGHQPKVVLLGPMTYLWLGKCETEEFDKLLLLDKFLPAYSELLIQLKAEGVDWVQIDEPILGLDLPMNWRTTFDFVYNRLQSSGPKKMIATYFGSIGDNLQTLVNLPVDGIHVDAIHNESELDSIVSWLPRYKILSVGIIDGRNIWAANLRKILDRLYPLKEKLGDNLWLSTSCSLLHVPVDLSRETRLDPEIKSWLAFSVQKLDELNALKKSLNQETVGVSEFLDQNQHSIRSREQSPIIRDEKVRMRTRTIDASLVNRNSQYAKRANIQRQKFGFPRFPTTTIGSFPQTQSIRQERLQYKRQQVSHEHYVNCMKQEIRSVIQKQEALGLDVLVHGEAERNDMVEYFGEQLQGFVFSEFAWVQSYGSRCVKPPIIYGDIQRKKPMTVEWSQYAQSLTEKPVKGMLTGPVTILNWSFVRDDQPRAETCLQIALAIRDEVIDLEAAGIHIIQIDEAALREGMPLRKAEQKSYLSSAVRCFRISSSGVKDSTQIHTHMCYSEFNEIMAAITEMDADVITIECSRSHQSLLKVFSDFEYPNQIGPGVYDIHSPNIPNIASMMRVLENAKQFIPVEKLWVNPDCGLKTRNWLEVEPALLNMVAAARELRKIYTE